jgi:hypothetical protein
VNPSVAASPIQPVNPANNDNAWQQAQQIANAAAQQAAAGINLPTPQLPGTPDVTAYGRDSLNINMDSSSTSSLTNYTTASGGTDYSGTDYTASTGGSNYTIDYNDDTPLPTPAADTSTGLAYASNSANSFDGSATYAYEASQTLAYNNPVADGQVPSSLQSVTQSAAETAAINQAQAVQASANESAIVQQQLAMNSAQDSAIYQQQLAMQSAAGNAQAQAQSLQQQQQQQGEAQQAQQVQRTPEQQAQAQRQKEIHDQQTGTKAREGYGGGGKARGVVIGKPGRAPGALSRQSGPAKGTQASSSMSKPGSKPMGADKPAPGSSKDQAASDWTTSLSIANLKRRGRTFKKQSKEDQQSDMQKLKDMESGS